MCANVKQTLTFCNVCGGNIFHIDKEEVYDLESRHNIVVDIIKVCDECGNIIDY